MKIQIVVAAYNCRPYIERCLESIASQNAQMNQEFEVAVVDDHSDDGTDDVVRSFARKFGWAWEVNRERKHALWNQVDMIRHAFTSKDPADVLVFVDGDDRLAHADVLSDVWHDYMRSGRLVVYGSYAPDPPSVTCAPAQRFPVEAWDHPGGLRGWSWENKSILFNHLRTFRRVCFDHMIERDFRGPDGEFFRCVPDTALMYPALEMAGAHRTYMSDETRLIYTSDNGLSEWRLRPRDIDVANAYILSSLPAHRRLDADWA
jgi:glycosyltransferase involved in cell wall biosynthesis